MKENAVEFLNSVHSKDERDSEYLQPPIYEEPAVDGRFLCNPIIHYDVCEGQSTLHEYTHRQTCQVAE